MTWFRYLPVTANPSIPNQDTSYVYPILRRKINIPILKQDVEKDNWLFVDISDVSIDKFISSSLQEEIKQNSYIVVYESRSSDDYNFRINSSTYSEKKSKSSIEASEIHSFDEDLENGQNI